jgi:hypothetical protein
MSAPSSLGLEEFRAAVRAAAEVYGQREFVVVGRGSLSASLPESAALLRMTEDIDLYPTGEGLDYAVLAGLDPELGVQSDFFAKHGFYVQRVGDWTVMYQPAGWEERAIRLEVDGIKAIVLHPIDLAYNKLEAGRDKDIEFIAEGLRCGVYQLSSLEGFIREGTKEDWKLEALLTNLQKAQSLVSNTLCS